MYTNGRHISTTAMRDVWAAVTHDSRLSLRALARTTGHAVSTTHAALFALRQAGYIDYVDNAECTRTVLVPFVVMDDPAGKVQDRV